jgi:adenylate cyclase
VAEPASPAELEKQNRTLARKLARLQTNMAQLEEIRDTNSTILSNLMRELDAERKRSQELLLNILPQQIVDRLESGETLIADRYESVSVLFGDLVGFTATSAALDPKVLVATLNRLFSEFDAICANCGMEKVKTIGDAYLAVGGLPGTREDHVPAAAEMALAMLEAIEGVNAERETAWQIRIGLHVGPAVAGVIGTWKYVYDVWGDTVNMASRLETSSEPGRVHVSSEFAELLPKHFLRERRGTVELKGKGPVATFFLTGG